MVNLTPTGKRDAPGKLLLTGRIGVAMVFGLLGLSFWSLQVGQYERLIAMAENNHDRTISLRAPRGAIVDRDGRVLVDNRYTFNISMIREQVTELDRSLELLGRVTGASPETLRAAVDDQRNVPAFRPIVVVRDASLAQVAAVQARAIELPGVIVEHDPARYYPGRETASHLFGYVGEAQEHQLAEASDPRVAAGAVVGQSGIEQAYNLLLMGENGTRRVAVNNVGREIETIGQVAPRQGRQLRLTIDLDVQQAAEEAFASAGFEGAAVALDPRSGRGAGAGQPARLRPCGLRAAHRPGHLVDAQQRRAPAAAEPCAAGTLCARVHVQGGDGGGRPRGGRDYARLQRELQRRRRFLSALLPLPFPPRAGGPGRGAGEVLQHLLLHAGQQDGHRRHPSLGDGAWARRAERRRPAARAAGAHPVAGMEAVRVQPAVVPGRDAVGGDRAGRGIGHADLAGRDDVHGRVGRPAAHSAHAAGCARDVRLGCGGASRARAGGAASGHGGGRPRRPLDGREPGRHRTPGADRGP